MRWKVKMVKKSIFIGIAGIVAICGLLIMGFHSTDEGTRKERVGGGDIVKVADIEVNTETIYIEE